MPEDKAVTFKSKLEAEVAAAEAQAPSDIIKVAVCDAARSIWKYLENNERFKDYEKIVDYWHTVEHLSLAAEALFGKDTDEAKQWYDLYAGKLLDEEDGAQRVINSIDYFSKNRWLSPPAGVVPHLRC